MLSQKAMLVYLSISKWDGNKRDKQATEAVEHEFKAQKGAVRAHKSLLPGNKQLARIRAQAQAINNYWKYNTLPWLQDGTRIIPAEVYMDFIRKYNAMKNQFDANVEAFLQEYALAKQSARTVLGDLFNEHEYPSQAALADRFKCTLKFMPLPETGDFRVELSPDDKQAFIDMRREVEEQATRDLWQRLFDVVNKAAQSLATIDKNFHASTIDNITDLCALLTKLNITNDPALETARQDVEALALSIHVDTCRVNKTEREAKAKALADVADKMGAFMGAKKGE